MNTVDIIIILILIVGFILGYKDGIIRKIIGLIGLVLGFYLAVFFAAKLGNMFEGLFGMEEYMAVITAGFLIFIIIVIIFSILKRVIHPHDKVNGFVNQFIGGIAGALQLLFFTSAVLYIVNIFGVPKKEIKENSFLYFSVYNLIPQTVEFVSQYTPAEEDTLRFYIKDTRISD